MEIPKRTEERFVWTTHSKVKMRQYGLSESRVKKVLRFPERVEEGIAPNTIAVMRPSGRKKYSEIWVMYVVSPGEGKQLKIITAWIYPAKSPERDPIPPDILREVADILKF